MSIHHKIEKKTMRLYNIKTVQFVKHIVFNYIKNQQSLDFIPLSTTRIILGQAAKHCCSASEVRHPSEVRHLHFITILKSFYCPVTTYMCTLLLQEAIPFI